MKRHFIFWLVIATLFFMAVYDALFIDWIEKDKVHTYISDHVFVFLLIGFLLALVLWAYRFFYVLQLPIKTAYDYLPSLMVLTVLCFAGTFGWTSLWNRIIGPQQKLAIKAEITSMEIG